MPFSLFAQTNVLTQHNDIGRTGQNLTETILTPQNVSSGTFGKLYSIPLDGQAFAQPLYVSNLQIGGATRSVLFVATEHDSVYAFDTNAGGAQLWKASLLDAAHGAAPGAIPEPESDTGCTDITPENGITGTPVIDASTGTLYVVSATYEGSYPLQRLHALDITTGAEKFGAPVVIQATAPGTGDGSSNGLVSFDPRWQNQRAGLLLVNGSLYIGWSSHCDFGPWHGWVMSYHVAAGQLRQTGIFLSTSNGEGGGIWMSGAGLAADNIGGNARMFVPTGNGTFDGQADWSQTVLNLNLAKGLAISDSFTPYNQNSLSQLDADLASGGLIVLPDQPGAHPHLAAVIGKSADLYLLDRENLGGNSAAGNNVVQDLDASFAGGLWGMPAYFNGNIYYWPSQGSLLQYSLTNGLLSTSPIAQGSQTENDNQVYYFGSSPSISANGNSNGIVWVDDWVASVGTPTQTFYAYDATNVSRLLWSSAANSARDGAGLSQKFAFPTIADGKVFLAAQNQMQVYGLFEPAAISITPSSGSSSQQTFTALYSDTSGGAALAAVYVLFNTTVTASHGCYVLYYPPANLMYLKNTAGTANSTGIRPGSSGQVSNSLCTLYGAGSSYTISGNTATLSLALTFNTAATNNIYLYAADKYSINTGWIHKGSWSSPAPATESPSVVSVTPSAGTGPAQTFTAVYSDPHGGAALNWVSLLFNTSIASAHGCYVSYDPTPNLIYLMNDAGTGWAGTVALGTSGYVSNSQCVVSAAGATYHPSVTGATFTVPVTFSLATPLTAYLYASESNGSNSGWIQAGIWTP